MDPRSTLVAVALAALSACAQAGYAQASPPPGWSPGGGPGGSFAGAANAETFAGGARASTVVNVGGRGVTMPAAMRFAANAGRFAARGLFLNPLAVGAIAGAWLASQCLAYQGGQWVLTCGGNTPPQSDGFEYRYDASFPWVPSRDTACDAAVAYFNGVPGDSSHYVRTGWNGLQCKVDIFRDSDNVKTGTGGFLMQQRANASCPAGWYLTPAGCVQTPPPQPVTQQEFEDKMAPQPIPDGLPREMPGVPLPIEIPVINPTPGTNPTPQPLWVPQGNPVPVPNTDPRQYTQPGVRLNPAPTTQNPWQVDVQPENRTGTDPTGAQEPVTDPVPADPDAEKPEPDLCEKHPDILACQKLELGQLEPLTVPNTDKQMAINKDEGWGASNASCPPPKTATFLGRTWSFPWTVFCDFASMIRPLLIGFAWLSAALTFMGLGRKD